MNLLSHGVSTLLVPQVATFLNRVKFPISCSR
jgi:hypothetical protein